MMTATKPATFSTIFSISVDNDFYPRLTSNTRFQTFFGHYFMCLLCFLSIRLFNWKRTNAQITSYPMYIKRQSRSLWYLFLKIKIHFTQKHYLKKITLLYSWNWTSFVAWHKNIDSRGRGLHYFVIVHWRDWIDQLLIYCLFFKKIPWPKFWIKILFNNDPSFKQN